MKKELPPSVGDEKAQEEDGDRDLGKHEGDEGAGLIDDLELCSIDLLLLGQIISMSSYPVMNGHNSCTKTSNST